MFNNFRRIHSVCLSPLNLRASKYFSDESDRLASGLTNFTFE